MRDLTVFLCEKNEKMAEKTTEGDTLNIFAPERIKEKCENIVVSEK